MLTRVCLDFVKSCQLTQSRIATRDVYRALSAYKNSIFDNDSKPFDYSYRVTTKPSLSREVSFRCIEVGDEKHDSFDPYKIAQQHELIDTDGCNNKFVNKCYTEIVRELGDHHCDFKYGIDISATKGLQKIWILFENSVFLSTMLNKKKFKYFPKCIDSNLKTLEKYDINSIDVMGFDFKNNTVNIYKNTNHNENNHNENILNEIAADLKLSKCTLFDEIPLNKLLAIGLTLNCDNIIRFCPYWIGNKHVIPNQFYYEIPKLNELPFYNNIDNEEKKYISAICVDGINPDNYYGKLEWDYYAKRPNGLNASLARVWMNTNDNYDEIKRNSLRRRWFIS